MGTRNQIFDTFAYEYDLFRPRYPDGLAREIAAHVGLVPSSKLLEIGCGSGQATEAFAKLGHGIEALDPSDSLLAIASKRFSEHHSINFHCLPFENYESSDDAFDLIFSANAFHWVKPEIGWKKVARLARPKGHFSTLTIKRDLEPEIRERLDDLYKRYKSAFSSVDSINPIPNSPNSAVSYQQEHFDLGEKIVFEFEVVYEPQAYVGLMRTMSDHRMLPANIQSEFFSDLKSLCESFGNIKTRNIASAQIFHVKMN